MLLGAAEQPLEVLADSIAAVTIKVGLLALALCPHRPLAS